MNVIQVNYGATGQSTAVDALGMRDMQARAYAKRREQYLLLKAPPASGKSRALMYLALDKLEHQGVRKVIVAVPERTIGGSFAPVRLTESGFFADWMPERNLCTPGGDDGKVASFVEFMENDESVLICTHATLRFAFEKLPTGAFSGCLLGIDEFHHVSADCENSRLGALLHDVMRETDAHVLAMTGSYFRGDNVPILLPEYEARFSRVVYTYYDQLNGYKYLKSLGIGYHFYQGRYLDALQGVLDTDRKTILHIPNVNSGESTKEKYDEVGHILDMIGTVEEEDMKNGLLYVRRADGRVLKVADLVNDDPAHRNRLVAYLREVKQKDELDIIIALGMAKEGFDWPWCEHALTVGYRGSLTEIIQIIGRATRDCPGKAHTQFTNLVAAPAAKDAEVTLAVNNMLKAVTASLLMEQVLTPEFKFRARTEKEDDEHRPGTIHIRGFREPSTRRVRDIVENDLADLKARIMQDDKVRKLIAHPDADPRIVNKVLVPKIIVERYPGLTEEELEEVRQAVVTDCAIRRGETRVEKDTVSGQSREFIRMGERFINVNELNINLIDSINPFHGAFEIMSRQLTAPVPRLIRDAIAETRITMSLQEAIQLWESVKAFIKARGREPDPNAEDANEAILGQALVLISREKRRRKQHG